VLELQIGDGGAAAGAGAPVHVAPRLQGERVEGGAQRAGADLVARLPAAVGIEGRLMLVPVNGDVPA
jgi:hypothetical protein